MNYMWWNKVYFASFTIFILAGVFGGIGVILALFIIRDAFTVFHGLNIAYYLLMNSLIVFVIAILVTIIKKYNRKKLWFIEYTKKLLLKEMLSPSNQLKFLVRGPSCLLFDIFVSFYTYGQKK